jgi:hypothetical protein
MSGVSVMTNGTFGQKQGCLFLPRGVLACSPRLYPRIGLLADLPKAAKPLLAQEVDEISEILIRLRNLSESGIAHATLCFASRTASQSYRGQSARANENTWRLRSLLAASIPLNKRHYAEVKRSKEYTPFDYGSSPASLTRHTPPLVRYEARLAGGESPAW